MDAEEGTGALISEEDQAQMVISTQTYLAIHLLTSLKPKRIYYNSFEEESCAYFWKVKMKETDLCLRYAWMQVGEKFVVFCPRITCALKL